MIVALSSCKGKGNGRTSQASEVKTGEPEHAMGYAGYLPPDPPAIMTGQEQIMDFYRFHFWDNLTSSMYEEKVDTMMMLDAFVAYLQLLTDGGTPNPQPVEKLMEKCLTDKPEEIRA